MRLRLNDQAVLCVEFMVEQHPEKHSICPFLCQRYAITGALQLFTTFLQLLQRKGRHKRTRDEWKKFHESRIVRALKPYRAAWGRMKGAKFCSRQWSPRAKKALWHNGYRWCNLWFDTTFTPIHFEFNMATKECPVFDGVLSLAIIHISA